jgi:hypothetical protein
MVRKGSTVRVRQRAFHRTPRHCAAFSRCGGVLGSGRASVVGASWGHGMTLGRRAHGRATPAPMRDIPECPQPCARWATLLKWATFVHDGTVMQLRSKPTWDPLPSSVTDGQFSVLDEANHVIASIGRKANKNKERARRSALALTGSTALVPVLLIVAEQFSDGSAGAFWFGRLLPGMFAAVAAIVSRWMQIEQPHQRWTLYRHWQRHFEAERLRYRQGLRPFDGDDRDGLLAKSLADGQERLDSEWSALVPISGVVSSDHDVQPSR